MFQIQNKTNFLHRLNYHRVGEYMKNDFEIEVKHVLKNAEREMYELNHPYVGSEHVLLAILKDKSQIRDKLNLLGVSYEIFKNNLIKIVGKSNIRSETILYTPLLKKIIQNSLEIATIENRKVILNDIVISLLESGEGIAIRILLNMNVDLDELYNLIRNGKKENRTLIYKVGKDLNKTINDEHIYKRDKEIKCMEEILLRKNKNNPLLIGEAGVGKTAIVEEFVRLIRENKVPDKLLDYRVIELDTGSLIAGTRFRGDFEEKLGKIIDDVIEDGHIILFIDEIHTLIHCGGADGAIDAANILKPYLARGKLKIIGATTRSEYEKSIKKDKAFDRRFEIINVEEPSLRETEYILKKIKPSYEKYHDVVISDANIKDIVRYSNKYILNRYNPDKAIDIMDLVCAHVQTSRPNSKSILYELNKKKEKLLKNRKYNKVIELELKYKDMNDNNKIQISREDILNVIEYKIDMPVIDNFGKTLSNLDESLKKIVYGEDDQIDRIINLLKGKYLVENTNPLSIILKGPSGVGKSFVATEIANILFGCKHLIKINVNEFKNTSKILSSIKSYPYSVILFENLENANIEMQTYLTNIIKNGYVTYDAEKISLNNSTLFMLYNTRNYMGFGNNSSDIIIDNLRNEVDDVIEFNPIDSKAAVKYIKRECNNVVIPKCDIDNILSLSNINRLGMQGVQKELNKYKISKLLSKV